MRPRSALLAAAVMLATTAATFAGIAAAAGERNPFDYSFLTYLWVMSLSAFGGIVNFSRKLRDRRVTAFRLTEFIGELVTSAFAGLLTFWLCESQGVNPLISAVMIAISGHMGSRAIFKLERWLERRQLPGEAE